MKYFLKNEWTFHNKNLKLLEKAVNSTVDGHLFNVSIGKDRNFAWNDFFKDYTSGIRKFRYNEDMSTINVAKKRLKRYVKC